MAEPNAITRYNRIKNEEIRLNTLEEYDYDYSFTNLIPNADMKKGWNYSALSREPDVPALEDNCLYIRVTGTTSISEVLLSINSTIPLNNTHKYYSRVYGFQKTKTVGSIGCYWPIAKPPVFENYPIKDAGKWQMYSGVNNRTTHSSGNHQLRFDFNNNKIAGTIYFTCPMLIDLTATFGAGKEPTRDWCDEHIPFAISTGYIYTDKQTSIEYKKISSNEFIELDVTVTKISADRVYSPTFIEG